MGFDFSILPGGGGLTGEVNTGLDLVIETSLCLGTETTDVFACMRAIVDIFTLIFDLFFGDVFHGRPKVGKDSASDDTALFFIASTNPVIQHWGFGIRGLEGKGIPTSVSAGPGLTLTINLANAVLGDLKTQFDHPAAPKLFYHSEFGTYPVTGLNMFSWYHQLGFRTNHPDSNREAIQIRAQIDHFYTELVTLKWIDPHTGFPFTKVPPPPPPPPKPQPPSQVPKPPPAPPHNADEQEICCWYEEQYYYHLAVAAENIYNLMHQQGADEKCCAEIVAAIGAVNRSLSEVVSTLGHSATAIAAKIDLSHIAAGLQELLVALNANLHRPPEVAPALIAALDRIAAAEERERPIDLKPLADQLAKLISILDIKPHVIHDLVQKGFIKAEDAQIIGSADVSDWFFHKFNTWVWDALLWVAGWVGLTWDGHKWHAKPISETVVADISRLVDDALKAGSEPMYPIIKGLIDGVVKQLNPTHAVAIGNVGVDADALVTKTLVPALIVNGIVVLAAYFNWDIGEGWQEYVNLVSEFTGLAEVAEIQVGQRMRFGPMRVAEMHAKQLYRQEIPSSGTLYSLAARAQITPARAAAINGFNGVPDELHGPLQQAAYHGLPARTLLRLLETGLFTAVDIADELTFGGMRAASQHRLLMAAPYLATEPERKQLRATYEKAYIEGFSSDAQLTQQLDDAEHNTSRTFLILDRVRLEKRMALAKDLEAEYSAMYLGNLINLATYHADLAGLGLQDDRVRALSAKYEARAAVTLARQEAAAARALARATAAEERKVAMRNYIQGNINAAGLAVALEETGLTHIQTAAWVDMAALEVAGKPRYSFGLRLAPDAAQLLTDRVRALNDQRKRQLLTDIQYRDQLRHLHVPDNYINALRAASDATITPAKSAVLLPVETGA